MSSNLQLIIKLLIVGLIALSVSYISDEFSEPPPLEISKKYNEEYRALTSKPLSGEEFSMLQEKARKYVEELTSSKNTSDAVQYMFYRKLIIVPLASFLWFVVGWKIGFISKRFSVVSALFIGWGALFSVNMLEAFFYVVFFFIGNYFIWNKAGKNKVEF